jgi:hypothetical protein
MAGDFAKDGAVQDAKAKTVSGYNHRGSKDSQLR